MLYGLGWPGYTGGIVFAQGRWSGSVLLTREVDTRAILMMSCAGAGLEEHALVVVTAFENLP